MFSASEPFLPRPGVTVLIVTYNSAEDVGRCLASVFGDGYDGPLKVIVVDNQSEDDSIAVVRDQFPQVTLIENADNVGFARAVNQVAAMVDTEYLVLVNPDARLHEGCLEHLVACATRTPIGGIYGGRCLTGDGRLDPGSCWGHRTLWAEVCFGLGLSAAFRESRWFDPRALGGWPRDTEAAVGVVTGCLLLSRVDTWRELGGFDERFWLYAEDIDLSERAWERGYRPMITPLAVITHDFGSSSSTSVWRKSRTLQGMVTLLEQRHGRLRASGGLALLKLGVWLRGSSLLNRLLRRETEAEVWRGAWNDRQSWTSGFEAGPR